MMSMAALARPLTVASDFGGAAGLAGLGNSTALTLSVAITGAVLLVGMKMNGRMMAGE